MRGLAGLRVLDLSEEIGLLCGQLLADMGASVHQLVRPEKAAELDIHFWQAHTLGKRVEVVDWRKHPRLVTGFAAEADVLITSVSQAELARLGTDCARLRQENPGLIHLSITAFGADGPKSDFAATDLTVVAASGYLYLSGVVNRQPLRISADQAHAHAATDAVVALLIALADRDRTGLGQYIDISAQQSHTLPLMCRSLDKPAGDPGARRFAWEMQVGNASVKTQYRCADGWVVALPGILPPLVGFMQRLMAWVLEAGHCTEAETTWDWGATAARMAIGQISAADWAPVQQGIEKLLSEHTKEELMQAALDRRLLLAPVLELPEILDSPHMTHRQAWTGTAKGKRLGAFARFSESPLPLAESAAAQPGPRVIPASSVTAAAGSERPLEGVKVLDLFWVIAGPGATRMLADHGATVIHVESSSRIDMVRNIPPYAGGVTHPENALAYHSTNANKLNLTLNLGQPEARAVLRDLIAWADVVAESFTPGVMARLGFDYAAISAINPSAIMISSTLMGQTGPWAAYSGYGNLGAAVSGIHALTGRPGEPPTGCFGPYTDFTSVRFNALAILLALRERALTGRGQYIDMAQSEAALQFLAPQCLAWLRDGQTMQAQGNRDARMAPQGVYAVAGDDRWLALSIRNDAEWQALCEASGDAALLETAGWRTDERRQHHDRLDQLLTRWLAEQDGEVVERTLQARRIPAHRVLDTHQVREDPQLNHREHFLAATHPTHGPLEIESSRLRMSRSQPRRPDTLPTFGADNERVLKDILGYDDARLAALQAAGALQ